jgi:hypothetical protein
MKLPIMLFSACLVASLFDVGPALPQTPRPSPAESASHRQAMDKCQELYGAGGARWDETDTPTSNDASRI